jgi:hypothetical protein
MGAGRDIVGFLFTCDALGMRLRRQLELPGEVRAKLAQVRGAALTAFAPEAEPAEAFRQELSAVAGATFGAAGQPPSAAAGWTAARAAIRDILDPLNLPGNGVILIGTRGAEADWMAAAGMAKFLGRESYFAAATGRR